MSEYKLYYAPKSASMGVRVILEELDVSYELIESTTDMNEARSPEQLAINPNGWLPVLVWNNGHMYEFAAITMFLGDRHPTAEIAPSIDNPMRALYLQTLVYFSNSVQNAFQLSYYPDRFADLPTDEASAQRRGNHRLKETWQVIDEQIAGKPWILGEQFSLADIYLFALTTWLRPNRGHPSIEQFPNVMRIANKVALRPSVQLVYANWLIDPNY